MPRLKKQILSELPKAIDGLLDLALDLRYTWSHKADAIWDRLNSTLWTRTRNPWLVLQTASAHTLAELAKDKDFIGQINTLVRMERMDLAKPGWFEQNHSSSALKTIAYFSMEFGLSEALPIYSGGLGLLAGDHLKAAHDLRAPLVGIGILYQNGYFRQALDVDGNQIALYPSSNLNELPVTPVRDKDGELLRLNLHLPGHNLRVRVWQANIGRITLYLLDTNDPLNSPVTRCITAELYGGGQEQRLQQEILLGIGGWRVLQALNIHPEVCHLNEGHAAFAVLDRVRSYMKTHNTDFHTALTITRAGNLFTTHTPVEAGFDRFPIDMMRRHFTAYADDLGISIDDLLALGQRNHDDNDGSFNMAYLAIRGSGAANGVSKLHGAVSRHIFTSLFPDWPVQEVPVGHVTNGVHVPTWDSAKADELWTNICGDKRWTGDLKCIEKGFRQVTDQDLWLLRTHNRKQLLAYVRANKTQQFESRGLSHSDAAEQTRHLFDPNTLTLGFARRFATYKRPTLLLHDPERLIRILTNPDRPVQLVIAGKAHPADKEGQALIKQWFQFMQRPEVKNHVIFISDYDILVAEQLVSGVDVWINNPRRPWEASGTSGMKVLVNGGLNLSELDGWWAEAYTPDVGWALGDGQEHDADASWDEHEALQAYDLLENHIVSEFYDRNAQDIPEKWVGRMRESMSKLTPFYSTNRMVQQYLKDYYIPCAKEYKARSNTQGKLGTGLQTWRNELQQNWATMRIGATQINNLKNQRIFKVPVYLGDIQPEMVSVELFAEPQQHQKLPERIPMRQNHAPAGTSKEFLYSANVPGNRSANDYTVRIIPAHPHASIPMEIANILWQK